MTTEKVIPIRTGKTRSKAPTVGIQITAQVLDSSMQSLCGPERSVDTEPKSPVRRSGGTRAASFMGGGTVAVIRSERQYWITSEAVGVMQAGTEPPHGAVMFSSRDQLMTAAADCPLQHLVNVWNTLPGQRKIKKFENRMIAVRRLWRAVEDLEPQSVSLARHQTEPGQLPRDTKSKRILDLLKSPGGASLTTLMEATGWQAHSIRGFLSRNVGQQDQFRLSSLLLNGERIYALEPAAGNQQQTPTQE